MENLQKKLKSYKVVNFLKDKILDYLVSRLSISMLVRKMDF